MDTQPTTPSVEVARTQAIANVYRQLGSMDYSTADDALDAALAIARLSEAEAHAAKAIRRARIPTE